MPGSIPKMISVGRNAPKGRWHIEPHHHSGFEMVVVTGGCEDVVVSGNRIRAEEGDVLLFKPGVDHEEWSAGHDPLQTYYLSFRWRVNASDWPLRSVDEDGRLRLLCMWLYAGRDASAPETQAVSEAFFQALVREFVRLQGRREDPLVISMRQFIRQNIGAALTVDMLARHAGISKFHFIRRYRRLTGRTPMEEVRMIRVGHARDLILTSNLPVKAVAPMSGLGDEISLYRVFRRYLNITPGQLRRTIRK